MNEIEKRVEKYLKADIEALKEIIRKRSYRESLEKTIFQYR